MEDWHYTVIQEEIKRMEIKQKADEMIQYLHHKVKEKEEESKIIELDRVQMFQQLQDTVKNKDIHETKKILERLR